MFGGRPGNVVMDVARNELYVSGIHFVPPRLMTPIGEASLEQNVTTNTTTDSSTHGTGSELMAFQDSGHDSIVTEALLRMTSPVISDKEGQVHGGLREGEEAEEEAAAAVSVVPGDHGLMIRRNEDMDRVIQELSHAVVKSRNVATLTKAMSKKNNHESLTNKGSTSSVSLSRKQKLRNSIRALKALAASNRGSTAMKELWER